MVKTGERQNINKKVRILLVDDHPVTRLGLKSLLNTTEDLQVIGETGDAERRRSG